MQNWNKFTATLEIFYSLTWPYFFSTCSRIMRLVFTSRQAVVLSDRIYLPNVLGFQHQVLKQMQPWLFFVTVEVCRVLQDECPGFRYQRHDPNGIAYCFAELFDQRCVNAVRQQLEYCRCGRCCCSQRYLQFAYADRFVL